MKDNTIIRILKVTMTIGICLILLGVYFHLFNSHIDEMGIKGIIISAACVAIGMILSLPTKMFLTFIQVNREAEQNKHSNKS